MTTTPLPPTKHDHPDVHSMIWTQSELVWIQNRDAQWQAYAAQARADLEAENSRLREALRNLLNDTQHADHPDCDDGPCPVREARAALKETP